jgi:hypothetical protein
MDPTSTIPSMTGGAGGAAGPSQASGSFFTTMGGLDGANWNVAFGQAASAGDGTPATMAKPSVATPVAVGYSPDQFGLPNFMTAALGEQTAHAATTTTAQAVGVSPVMLVAIVLVAVVILRHAK